MAGRRGEPWQRLASQQMSLSQAVAVLHEMDQEAFHADPSFRESLPAGSSGAARFAPGQQILWRYGRFIDTARVIRDDARGLVVWIPSGSARLESMPADGRQTRDVPLDARFSVPWVVRESTWRGPGIVRVAPTGRPWSVWFFRDPEGSPAGAYVNLELPHRRVGGETGAVFTRDLVLDLWIDAEHAGSEDVWLKDGDELGAAVTQGRFTEAQADAVRAVADHAVDELIMNGSWPLNEGWAEWSPRPAMDVPLRLPEHDSVQAARRRSGRTSLEG